MVRNRAQKLAMVDESPATIGRLEEAYAAIVDRRFRPWHAGDLLSVARTPGERRAAVAKIVDLVAGGAEGRGMVVRLEAGRRRRGTKREAV